MKESNNSLNIYINISTRCAITKWSQDQCTRDNVSKIERKEKIQKSSLHPSYTLPLSQKDSVHGHGRDEEAEVDEAVEARGVVVSVRGRLS